MRFLADPVGKPPLLLMHGFLSSRHHWLLNEPALRARYRLIIAELPGHGETPPCSDPARVSPDALAECFESARLALNIPRWHICGQSLGAGLVLRYAMQYPDSVGAIVWTNANRVLLDPLTPDQIKHMDLRGKDVEKGGLDAIRRERFYPGSARYFPDAIRELLVQDADSSDPATIAALIRNCLSHISLRNSFKTIAAPALLINGFRERGFQQSRNLAAELLPSMKIIDLDGGHSDL